MSNTYSEYSYFQAVILSPIVPNGLELDQIGDYIRLSWFDTGAYEDGFVIERKINSSNWKKMYFTDEKKDFFTDYGPFNDGDIYYYRIRSYIILPNQKYLFSDFSDSNFIIFSSSSSSISSNAKTEIEFGTTVSITLNLNEKKRVFVKDYSSSEEYFWLCRNEYVVVNSHENYADIFAIKSGTSTVVLKRKSDGSEGIINVEVIRDNINSNPSQVSNLRARSKNNSSIELLWNYSSEPDPSVSHFEIYRIKKTGTSSKNNLIDFSDLSKNKVGIVPFDSLESIYNFSDYGLKSGIRYVYTVVVISKYNKSSLYIGNNEYNYVKNNKYIFGDTENSDIDIEPSFILVEPDGSTYLSIKSNITDFSTIEWEFEENNSNSQIKLEDEEVAFYDATDKSISEDLIKVQADSKIAKAKIIVTETI